MGKYYSLNLRERAGGAYLRGESCRSVSARFEIAPSTVVKWAALLKRQSNLQPGKVGGHRKRVLEPWRDFILARIADTPHLTLETLTALLARRGVTVSPVSVWNFLKAEGLSFKKTVYSREQLRPDVARKRRRWKRFQGRLDPHRLVIIDETWVKTNMAPLRGWGAKGGRVLGRAPQGQRRTLTFLAALRTGGLKAPCVFNGPINGEAFRAWVARMLVRALSPGDIVVMDNLGSHKSVETRQLIRYAGARLCFLPPYSPDLNLIDCACCTIGSSIISRPSPRSNRPCAPLRREPSRPSPYRPEKLSPQSH